MVKNNVIVIYIKNPQADIVAGSTRTVRTPGIAGVQKAADAQPQCLFQSRLAVGNSFIQQSDASVQAQPSGPEPLPPLGIAGSTGDEQ